MVFKDTRFIKPNKNSLNEPQNYLYVSGAGDGLGTNRNLFIKFFSTFGELSPDLYDDEAVFFDGTLQDYEELIKKQQEELLRQQEEDEKKEKELEEELLLKNKDNNANDDSQKEKKNKRKYVVKLSSPAFSQEDCKGIYFPFERRYCFVGFKEISSSINCYNFFQDEENVANFFNLHPEFPLEFSKLHVKYAKSASSRNQNPLPECTSAFSDITIPGLFIINNFLTEEEEKRWIEKDTEEKKGGIANENGPWKESMNRRVQHYGYSFSYHTLSIDYSKPSIEINEDGKEIANRIENLFKNHLKDKSHGEFDYQDILEFEQKKNSCTNIFSTTKNLLINEPTEGDNTPYVPGINKAIVKDLEESKMFPINQLTINEYYPGQGISSHIDTESCFGSGLFIVSLESSIVMTMTKKSSHPNYAGNNPETTSTESNAYGDKKYIILPRRSLLVLTRDARSMWTHGISIRKYDLVTEKEAELYFTYVKNKKLDPCLGVPPAGTSLVPRARRVSLTFRHVLPPPSPEEIKLLMEQGKVVVNNERSIKTLDTNKYDTKKQDEIEPPKDENIGDKSSINLEKQFVVDFYNTVAVHWHHTRAKRKVFWGSVQDFLMNLPKYSIVGDVGSGDGKYLEINPDITMIGCDRSWELLYVSRFGQNDPLCKEDEKKKSEKKNEKSKKNKGKKNKNIEEVKEVKEEVKEETVPEPTESNQTTSLTNLAPLNIFCADIVSLPWRSNSLDASICIAVLHHLSTEERRLAAIKECVRILKPGGRTFIQVWALEQTEEDALSSVNTFAKDQVEETSVTEENLPQPEINKPKQKSKHTFASQDTFVSWKLPKRFINHHNEGENPTETETNSTAAAEVVTKDEKSENKPPLPTNDDELIVYQRYCHVYKKGEMESLCSKIPTCRLIKSGWESGNWYVILEKI